MHVLLGAAFTGATTLLTGLGSAFTGATTLPAGLGLTFGSGTLAATDAATTGLEAFVGMDALAGLATWASRRWLAPAAGVEVRGGVALLEGLFTTRPGCL